MNLLPQIVKFINFPTYEKMCFSSRINNFCMLTLGLVHALSFLTTNSHALRYNQNKGTCA